MSDFDDEPPADTEAGIEANDEPADAAPPKEPAPNARPKPAPDDDWDDDWDDEDDKTTVYSRESGHMPTFGTLNPHIPAPSVVPGAPPPPMSRPCCNLPASPRSMP